MGFIFGEKTGENESFFRSQIFWGESLAIENQVVEEKCEMVSRFKGARNALFLAER